VRTVAKIAKIDVKTGAKIAKIDVTTGVVLASKFASCIAQELPHV